ncbi:MAG: hypothetical protein WA913_10160 [Pricia sp.]
MIKPKYAFLASMALALGTSCDKSSSDEFQEVNGNTTVKLISSISLESEQEPDEDEKVEFFYDGEKRLSSVTDGSGTSEFTYDEQGLSGIAGDGDGEGFNTEELFKSPYDAFETGDVVEYDDNKNPSKMVFFEEEYDIESDEFIQKQYTAELTYEDTPSVYFHTMEAAGMIDVLDKVQLNFAMQPQAQEIVKARALLPNNNISEITYKDEEGTVVSEITTDYSYDEDDYPTQVTVTSNTDGEIYVYKLNYEYLK